MSDNVLRLTKAEPYYETLVCGDSVDGLGDWYFACNICARRLDDQPCPDHAPTEVPGLRLVECDANPPHRMWRVDGDQYDPPCMICEAAALQARLDWHERCRHWGWRRWRITHRLAGKAYVLGLIAGHGTGGRHCKGCLSHLGWRGHRPYVLGLVDWHWACLLRRRHWPVTRPGFDFCGKCYPCLSCSGASCFGGICENQPAEVAS